MKQRFILAALFMMLATAHAQANDADDCVKASGDTKIAACTRAINSGRWQGANLAWAYNSRGIAKKAKGDLDGAIADYNRALEHDSRHAKAYYNRGNAKRAKGDLDGAIADYNLAIELDPRYVNAYGGRGNAKSDKGNLDGAIADYSRVLELDPRSVGAYTNRGRAHFYKGVFTLATADLARAQELKPYAYTTLWLFLARTRSGSDGKNELIANTAKLDTAKWPAPVFALYLGKGTPAAVLSGTENLDPKIRKDQLCEANFYIGQWQLTKGDLAKAKTSLRTARDQCLKTFIEYTGAVYELKRLGENP